MVWKTALVMVVMVKYLLRLRGAGSGGYASQMLMESQRPRIPYQIRLQFPRRFVDQAGGKRLFWNQTRRSSRSRHSRSRLEREPMITAGQLRTLQMFKTWEISISQQIYPSLTK